MDRTERFYRIEALIRSRGVVSFVDLMGEVEVSRATLKRDLEYLRSRMDAPIVYDRDNNGYRFEARSHRGLAPVVSHELPGVWFSEAEIHALLTMHQLIDGLDSSGTLGRHLQPLLDKLYGMMGNTPAESREMLRRVRIVNPARRPVLPRSFELCASALLRRERLQLTYYKRSSRTASGRSVSPQRLVHYRNTWYLDAWCHESDALRRFALDAMRRVDLLPTRAKEVALKTVEAQLDGGYGIYGGAATQTARLLFGADAAQWVAQEQWHPRQTTETLPDGRLRLSFPYGDDTELLMDLLRHGPDVEVESPPELRERLQARLRAALAQYP